jgi:predicted cation transporter
MFAERVRVLTATLWAGSLWTVGYLVAPLLFATLADRATAGNIAGSVFHVQAWLSVFCAVILLLIEIATAKGRSAPERRRLLWLVMGMLGCTVVGYFMLHPFMAALRGAGATMDAGASAEFGILHGVSSVLYLIQSLLAVVLVLNAR